MSWLRELRSLCRFSVERKKKKEMEGQRRKGAVSPGSRRCRYSRLGIAGLWSSSRQRVNVERRLGGTREGGGGGRAHLHAEPQPDCGAVPTGGPSRFVPSFLSQSALGFRTKSENGFLSRRLPRLPPPPPPLTPTTTTRRISLVYPSPLPRDFQLACSLDTSPQPLLSLIVSPISPFSL